LTCRWANLMTAVLITTAANSLADWQGWPVPTNESYYGASTNHYVSQLYSGLVERCAAASVAVPSVVDTWTVYAGETNTITTNTWVEDGATNRTVVTNHFIVYKTVTTTNQFEPFSYSYTNPATGASVTNMAYPIVKRSWLTTWDTKFDAILGSYVVTNRESNGSFNAYFATITNQNAAATPPAWTKTNLFTTLGIGYVTNTVAHWTKTPAHTNSDWLLAAIWSGGTNDTSWTYKRFTDFTNGHPRDAAGLPVAQYIQAGWNTPNVLTNLSLTLRGWAWNSTGTGLVSAAETVAFDSTEAEPLTYAWGAVTSITCTAQRPNSNDAIRITYTNQPTNYDTTPPYRLYAVHLNERQKALRELAWTWAVASKTNNSTRLASNPGANTNWSAATASADTTWPSASTTREATYGSWGYYPAGSGFVQARAGSIVPFRPNVGVAAAATGITVNVDFYWYSRAIYPQGLVTTGCVYEAAGTALLENQFALAGSNYTYSGTNTIEADAVVGSTNKPTWCGDPLLFPVAGGGAAASLGFNADVGLSNPGKAVLKWTGFEYK